MAEEDTSDTVDEEAMDDEASLETGGGGASMKSPREEYRCVAVDPPHWTLDRPEQGDVQMPVLLMGAALPSSKLDQHRHVLPRW